MNQIDDGDIINNIIPKIQMMKILIQQLTKEREDDFTSEKVRNAITRDIFKIQIRLNNSQNKHDRRTNNMGVPSRTPHNKTIV